VPTAPRTLRLRSSRLKEASGGVIGDGYALELFRRLGFQARTTGEGIEVVVPTYRGDIHEEMDLVEEVLRFYGYNKIPASLPRVTTGDARPYELGDAEDAMRTILVGSGMAEVVNYSFIHADHNALFGDEQPISITNALSENITSMRLSLMPGLLETVAHNRAYGVRDGALFEVGRTYHRDGETVREHHRLGMVMFGTVGSHWGDTKRPVDFYDIKGIVEQVAAKRHLALEFAPAETKWMRPGRRAAARLGDRQVATLGFVAPEVLQRFGVKGDVAAAEIDIEALLAATSAWTMAPVARFPGVPMILALTHGRDLPYERLIDTIRGLDVPHLHEVGLRDRFAPDDNADVIKTTLGMWYQAFDRSLTQEEVGQIHQSLASRVADLLPITLVSQEKS
jgi:phenylalanyl-tRNA synthetase beta chain